MIIMVVRQQSEKFVKHLKDRPQTLSSLNIKHCSYWLLLVEIYVQLVEVYVQCFLSLCSHVFKEKIFG